MFKSIVLVLCKNNSAYSRSLYECLNTDCIKIVDGFEDNILYIENFINLTKTIKTPCSWEKAFYRIKKEKLFDNYDYFYFIEDDVFSKDFNTFNLLIDYLKNNNADLITHGLYSDYHPLWALWDRISKDISFFNQIHLARSLNPFCRLSSRLIKDILDFQDQHKTFIFHEILFPSLAKQNNYRICYLQTDPQYKKYFSIFTYHRNMLKEKNIIDNKIYHSIKPIYDNSPIIKL